MGDGGAARESSAARTSISSLERAASLPRSWREFIRPQRNRYRLATSADPRPLGAAGEAHERVAQPADLAGIHSHPLHDLARHLERVARAARDPASVSAISSTRSSSARRARDTRPCASSRLTSGDSVAGSIASSPASSPSDRGELSHSASMTRYCGCVSPSGSRTGR